eukprot:gene9680-10510_t
MFGSAVRAGRYVGSRIIVKRIWAQQQYRLSTTPSNVHLRIIFGSQSGTAEAFANELEFDAQEANISTELIDALRFNANDLTTLKQEKDNKQIVNAFIVACYGEGEPTDNAKKFFESLNAIPAVEKNKFHGMNYGVFGLGNSQCFRDRYNVVGKGLDRTLESFGGSRVVPLGLGDASSEAVGENSMGDCWIAWKQNLLNSVQNFTSSETSSSSASSGATSSAPESFKNEQTADLTQQVLNSTNIPITLSLRQRAMIPANRRILMSTVSHVTQLFSKINETTTAVEVEFDLSKTRPLFPNDDPNNTNCSNYTQGLQPGDHIGVFAPNSHYIVEKFALAAGILVEELDQPIDIIDKVDNEPPSTLRQILTWQYHLSGVASITSIKLIQRWLKEQSNLTQTSKLFRQLEENYDSLVRDKGLDLVTVLEMIPKIPSTSKIPLLSLLKTLPTLNPRLYSITHMVLPGERAAATAAVANACPIAAKLQSSVIHSPTATDDYTKITLLCRLLRYRQTKSSANRIVDGVCSSYLNERIVPNQSEVAIFFRESNFHLPPPLPKTSSDIAPPVIMVAGGSGIAPFMSFIEERQRQLTKLDLKIGKGVLYFGCRNNDEYIFRDKLVSYLGNKTSNSALDRLVISFSKHQEDGIVSTTESLHEHEIIHGKEEHIPSVFEGDKEYLLPLIQQGGYIYVCGGAGLFGKAVREVINRLAIEAFQLNENEVDKDGKKLVHPGIRYLIQKQRYFEDLAD